MASSDNGGGSPAQAPAAKNNAPAINVLGQYLKDLSFENPRAPQSLAPREEAPPLNINVNVDARNLNESDYEVTLRLDAKAGTAADLMFQVEIEYAGVFRIGNVDGEQRQAVVLIECPRMLFPYARQIISESTRNGGFPPLMIDPIDFAALYQQNLKAREEAAAASSN